LSIWLVFSVPSTKDREFEEKMILAVTIADLYMNGKGSGDFDIFKYTYYDKINDRFRNYRIEEMCLPSNIKKYSLNRFDGATVLEAVCTQMRGKDVEKLRELHLLADLDYSLPFLE